MSTNSSKIMRWVGIIIAVVLVIWLISTVFGGGDSAPSEAASDDAAAVEQTEGEAAEGEAAEGEAATEETTQTTN